MNEGKAVDGDDAAVDQVVPVADDVLGHVAAERARLQREDPHQELRQALPYRGGGVGSGEVLAQCARATLIESSGRRPPSS